MARSFLTTHSLSKFVQRPEFFRAAMKSALLVVAAVAVLAVPAAGQSGPYKLRTMNFDLWCQETQHLPFDRCEKRLAVDLADFRAYRAKVEKFEIPYMLSEENAEQLDREILHYDPVDNPLTLDPAAASQSPNTPSTNREP